MKPKHYTERHGNGPRDASITIIQEFKETETSKVPIIASLETTGHYVVFYKHGDVKLDVINF